MTLLLITGTVVCAWAVLAVLSGERERRMAEPDVEPTAPKPPDSPPPAIRPNSDRGV